MKVRFSNIQWDTDGVKVHGLPKTVTLDVPEHIDLDSEGGDLLSDKFGYLVESFSYKKLSK